MESSLIEPGLIEPSLIEPGLIEPSLIDQTGPRQRVETWMALLLMLACPLAYWTMVHNADWRGPSVLLLVAMVLAGTGMAHVEIRRAREQPQKYRRGLATSIAALGWMHLVVIALLYAGWSSVQPEPPPRADMGCSISPY